MILLTKDKIIYSNHYNPECDKYVEKEVDNLYLYLNERVELISDGFTLEDLFKYIGRNIDEFNLIFSSHLGHHSLELFVDEIKKPGPEKDDEIDYLEIRRYGEYRDWGDIDLFIDFCGINGKEGLGYAIEFTPLNELKHLPLCLNKDFSISEVRIPSRIVMYLVGLLKKIGIPLGKWDNPFAHIYVRGKTNFTVYELISAVLYEISFGGNPEERDAKMSKIEEDVKEMKERYEKFDGGE